MPTYLESVNEKKQAQAVANKEQNELATMVRQLMRVQAASLAGSQGKSTVILTDQTDLGDKLKEGLKGLESAVSAIDPKDLNQSQLETLREVKTVLDSVKFFLQVSNQNAEKQNKDIISAIRSLEMSPVVNLPEPKVTVNPNKIDFSPIVDALVDNKQEIVFPSAVVDRFDLSRYKAHDIKETDNCQYVGFVNPESDWYIVENDLNSNRMRYVFGSGGYSKHFASASTFKYQIIDKAINASA